MLLYNGIQFNNLHNKRQKPVGQTEHLVFGLATHKNMETSKTNQEHVVISAFCLARGRFPPWTILPIQRIPDMASIRASMQTTRLYENRWTDLCRSYSQNFSEKLSADELRHASQEL